MYVCMIMRQTYVQRIRNEFVIGYVVCLSLLYQGFKLGERQWTSVAILMV